MPNLAQLPARDGDAANVIVETSRGSGFKLKYDEQAGLFLLHRVLAAGLIFPFDFGFIPSTRGEDGDPIDALLAINLSMPVGTLVKCRLVGVIEASQREQDGRTVRNDRLLAVPADIPIYDSIRDIGDLDAMLLGQVEAFFVAYNSQLGKAFEPRGRGDAAAARHKLAGAMVKPA
ncbi:MAG TPA: inorganic diphosphatase [Devosia sp.]|nr:inorganic diphosphatase [Devosia sp.]